MRTKSQQTRVHSGMNRETSLGFPRGMQHWVNRSIPGLGFRAKSAAGGFPKRNITREGYSEISSSL